MPFIFLVLSGCAVMAVVLVVILPWWFSNPVYSIESAPKDGKWIMIFEEFSNSFQKYRWDFDQSAWQAAEDGRLLEPSDAHEWKRI